MDPAFWDSSALVPLCVNQMGTPQAQNLVGLYRMAVWWTAPVEIRGAFARLVRMGQLTPAEHVGAQVRLERLHGVWREIPPSDGLRGQAVQLLDRYVLKAADALQLAAAMAWCGNRPAGRLFVAGDGQLLDAAKQAGFTALPV
jgi:uncharacterized protein